MHRSSSVVVTDPSNAPQRSAAASVHARRLRSVRQQDTAPEVTVRRALHAAGLRFRVHDRQLPGTPDIVLPRRASVVFVHGCFWHGHHCRHGRTKAKTNSAFWTDKIADNRRRDARKRGELRRLGWHVEVIWECQCGSPSVLGRLVGRLTAR